MMKMRVLASAVIAACALFCGLAQAQSPLSPTAMITEINTKLPTNGTQQITAATMRGVLTDMVSHFEIMGVDKTTNPWTLCIWGTSINCSSVGTINPITGDVSLICLFIPGGVSAVSRSCNTKIFETQLSVTDYGAVMNNLSIDSTAGVQAALDAAATLGGGQVVFPVGDILMGSVNVPQNVWVRGSGEGTATGTLIHTLNQTTNIFNAVFGSVGYNVRISDLGIISGTAGPQTGGFYFNFQNCSQCRIDHIGMQLGYHGILLTGSASNEDGIEYVDAAGMAGNVIWQQGGVDLQIHKVQTSARGDGTQSLSALRIENAGGTFVTNSAFAGCGNCTWIVPGTGQTVDWLFIDNTALGDSSTNGVGLLFGPFGTGTIRGAAIVNSWTASNKLSGILASCGGSGLLDGLIISNHRSINNGGGGMVFQCGTNISINNSITAGNSNPDAGGGGGTSGIDSGIKFSPGISNFNVANIVCQGPAYTALSQQYCVNVQTGASDHYRIQSINGLAANQTSGQLIFDGGSGTNKSVQGGQNADIVQLPSFVGPMTGAQGGTGVANTGKTVTLGASVTTTGAGAPTLAFPASPFTYTFQGSSDTIVGRATTDTLTNKTTTTQAINDNSTKLASTAYVQAQPVTASQMPALTGTCTTSAGAVATTCTQDGAWTAYTPTVVGGATTFTVNTSRWKQIGSKTYMVYVDYNVSNSAAGSNTPTFSLPNGTSATVNFPCFALNITAPASGFFGYTVTTTVQAGLGTLGNNHYTILCSYEAS